MPGFLSHADAQIGLVLDALDDMGASDNTIVVLLFDDGASGEAGPHGSDSDFGFAQGREQDVVGVIVEQGDCNGGWVWFAGDAAELRLQFCQRAHDPLACAESLSVP